MISSVFETRRARRGSEKNRKGNAAGKQDREMSQKHAIAPPREPHLELQTLSAPAEGAVASRPCCHARTPSVTRSWKF